MQIVVVKIGGSLEGKHLHIISGLVGKLHTHSYGVVLVHGGGPRISAALAEKGLSMPWHEGQRVTSPEAVGVVHDVLCGQVNGELVEALGREQVPAAGMCAADNILLAAPLPGLARTADVAYVRERSILEQVAQGLVPVIAPVGADSEGNYCNINADLAAASIAGALSAKRILFLTDVPGIYYDWDNKLRLVDVSWSELEQWYQDGAFTAGMLPKVTAVSRALTAGVGAAFVLDGSSEEAVMSAGLNDLMEPWNSDFGTRITSARGGNSDGNTD